MKDNVLPPLQKRCQILHFEQNLQLDAAQLLLVKQLDNLLEQLTSRPRSSKRRTLLSFWRRRNLSPQPKGLYIYGSVGRGKTMLMDLFYESLPRQDKLRVHFNDFMQDVQMRLERERQLITAGKTKYSDPILPVAQALAKQAQILCFDEFTVTDIADAMILGRLFAKLFEHGVVLVATSNVAPDNLYQNGLNRTLFLPFIKILKNHVNLFNLDGAVDYRLRKVVEQPHYFYPLDEAAQSCMNQAFEQIRAGRPLLTQNIDVRGRQIHIALSCGEVARFDFADLCAQALGSYDYAILAKKYCHFFIDNVPVFDHSMRNEAKRFILLIDTLYEARAQLFISAAALPDELYCSSFPTTESFEFARTASRLHEMQSADYLQAICGKPA